MKLSLIVAIGTNGAIGNKGTIPWKCSTDMKHFRDTTMDEWVVMGRKTWESLPPTKLPGRVCMVLTSQPFDDQRATAFATLDEAKAFAKAEGAEELFIIGGQRLFQEMYQHCDTLHVTTIKAEVAEADTFCSFTLMPSRWRLIASKDHDDCVIDRWVRR